MYSSCGSMEDAEKVFDELSLRKSSGGSVYPWNSLLRGNIVRGSWGYNDVLSTYSKLRQLGIDMNVYTFSCLIKSFAGSSALTQGLKMHALLTKNGFADGSIVLQTSLIDMYFKCGKIKLARQIFEEIHNADVVVWGSMISGFSHNRMPLEAIEYLRWMIREGIKLNSVILTAVLPVIGELWALKLGKEIHAYAIKTKSYASQLFVQTSLVDMYCKCGDMASARRIFYRATERNAISWTALVSGYISNGRLDQALRSINWMQQEGVKPDVVTIATILPVCGELKALKQGKEIHGYAVKNGFLPNVSIVTSLMVMYSRSGFLEYSCKLFDGLEKRNVISWTAMIDSYLKNHCLNEALVAFRSMQLSKHRPDAITISRMLSVGGEMKALKLGKEIHGYALRKDFVSIPFVSAEIVKMYGNCGDIEKAKLVFDANPSKGAMTRTAIIGAYGHNNRYEEALDLYNKMRYEGFSPNHYTFQVVLSICDHAGFVDEARWIFGSMIKTYNIQPSGEHYDSIIQLLTRLQYTDEAQRYVNMKSTMA
ncbi:Pentatricopeptide repeat-containing protein [Thalictrum thalictroides]|uniref:Pentatricopeptide repeat-containing protein n=1 Tax=Thalictrum thalictroides TaxID=46969 RepID=A0A7J6VKZ6_THATH|nr:Pentatricopeptide repeat-containing protein [Thalictrum thalictroides]